MARPLAQTTTMTVEQAVVVVVQHWYHLRQYKTMALAPSKMTTRHVGSGEGQTLGWTTRGLKL